MRYSQIRKMDISNGQGVGISLFVQGCHFHCKGCFNQDTWDFNGGKEWTNDVEDFFINLADRPFIKRISILGGEPLSPENCNDVIKLIEKLKNKYPDKKIWIYTGYQYENISNNIVNELYKYCDVLVDGLYIESKKDFNLLFKGSSNQRVINLKDDTLFE